MAEPLPPDDDELELEPVDPEILAHDRQRGKQRTNQAQAAVNEELIRNAEVLGDPISVEDIKSFRFTRRHLMILTALLALFMTACQLWGIGIGLFLFATLGVSGGWYFTMRFEQHHREEVAKLKEELAAMESDTMAGKHRASPSHNPNRQTTAPEPQQEPLLSFSPKEMAIAITVAAILLGLIHLLGAGPLSILLGMIALGGLIAQALGIEAPPIIVFGWWVLLVLYLLVGLWASTTNEKTVAFHPAESAFEFFR